MTSLDKAMRTATAEEVFMDLLRRFSAHNRNVSDKANANNYAPTAFAREDAARKQAIKKGRLTWNRPCEVSSAPTGSPLSNTANPRSIATGLQ